jgi:hypothetical protein
VTTSTSPADFRLDHHGSILILFMQSDAAHEWVAEHIPEPGIRWGCDGIVVEPRYVRNLVAGIMEDGLSITLQGSIMLSPDDVPAVIH